MKLLNDLDEIYGDGVVIEGDGPYHCPVCGKKYVRDSSLTNHYNSRICHSYRDVFKNTITEDALLNIYMNIVAIYNITSGGHGGRVSMNSFRKSRYYNMVAKFYMFCYINNIRDQIDYLQFLFEKIKFNNTFQVLNVGIRESTLINYMTTRRLDRTDDACDAFYYANRELLGDNTSFTIRSLERGDIRYDYLFRKIDADKFFGKLTKTEANNLGAFLETCLT